MRHPQSSSASHTYCILAPCHPPIALSSDAKDDADPWPMAPRYRHLVASCVERYHFVVSVLEQPSFRQRYPGCSLKAQPSRMCLFRLLTLENVFGHPRDKHRSRSTSLGGLADGTLRERLPLACMISITIDPSSACHQYVRCVAGRESCNLFAPQQSVGVERLAQSVPCIARILDPCLQKWDQRPIDTIYLECLGRVVATIKALRLEYAAEFFERCQWPRTIGQVASICRNCGPARWWKLHSCLVCQYVSRVLHGNPYAVSHVRWPNTREILAEELLWGRDSSTSRHAHASDLMPRDSAYQASPLEQPLF